MKNIGDVVSAAWEEVGVEGRGLDESAGEDVEQEDALEM